MARIKLCIVGLSLVGLFAQGTQGFAQFDDLSKWVPDSANSIVLLHAKRIFDSELSKTENWRKEHTKAFQSGAAFLPATIERIVIGSEIDLETMQPLWKVSIFEKYGTPFNLATLSERIGGVMESIAGHNALILPNDTYIVDIDDETIGAITPANRQSTSRWLASRDQSSEMLSPFLQRVIQNASEDDDMVLAINLTDCFSPAAVEKQLKLSGVVDSNIQPIADVVSSVQGLTLGITVRDKINGTLVIDFRKNAEVLKEKGKALLIDALETRGVMIDEFEDWTARQSGSQLTLTGTFSSAGFRRILSVVRHSVQNDVVFSDENQSPGDLDTPTLSARYFNKLHTILDELNGKEKGRALNTYATWFERYAHEIDQMPVLGIDADLVEFGQYMAESLRNIAASFRGHQLEKKAALAGTADTLYGWRYSYWGGSGSYGYRNDRSRERRQIATRHEVAAELDARTKLQEIEKNMFDLRRSLTQIYKIEF